MPLHKLILLPVIERQCFRAFPCAREGSQMVDYAVVHAAPTGEKAGRGHDEHYRASKRARESVVQ